MTAARRVLIVGGGVAGATLAVALADRGVDVEMSRSRRYGAPSASA